MPRDDILRSIEMRLRALGEISKYGTTAGAARGWDTREGAAPVQYVPVPRRQAAPPPEALNVPRRRPVVPQGGAPGTTPPAVREQLRQALAEVAARVTDKPQASATDQAQVFSPEEGKKIREALAQGGYKPSTSAPAQAQAPAPAPTAPAKPVLDPQKIRAAAAAIAARMAPKPQAAQQAPAQAPAPAPAPVRAPAPAPAPARAPAPQPAPVPSKPAVKLSPQQQKKLEDALARAQAMRAAGQPAQTEATPEMQRRAAQMQAAGHGGELSLEAVIEDLLGRKKTELKALFERTGDFNTIWDGIVSAFRDQIAKISEVGEAQMRRWHSHGIMEEKPANPPRPPKIPLPKQMRVNPRKVETPNVRTIKPPRLDNYVDNKK